MQRRANNAAQYQVFPLLEQEERRQRRIRNVHSTLDTERILQDDRMFAEVHSKQEEGWRLNGATIVT